MFRLKNLTRKGLTINMEIPSDPAIIGDHNVIV